MDTIVRTIEYTVVTTVVRAKILKYITIYYMVLAVDTIERTIECTIVSYYRKCENPKVQDL